MTEKRFILIEGFKKGTHTGIWDKWKQNNQRVGDELWLGEVVAMLNEGVAIVEENEQLKDAINQRTDQCDKYYKENEQLKDAINQRTDQCDKYYKENEQLKLSNQLLFEEMKEKIPNHPKLQKDLEYLMNEGMSREEALNMMILAWLSNKVE